MDNAKTVLLAGCAAWSAVSCASPAPRLTDLDRATLEAAERRERVETALLDWPEPAARAARRAMEAYGAPDEIRSGRLAWGRNGPWKRIVIRARSGPLDAGGEAGLLEQVVDYPMSADQAARVAAFDPKVGYAGREMSASADREEVVCLRLNLANDVALGRMTPAEAREAYSRVLELERAGKTSPYLLSLRFSLAP